MGLILIAYVIPKLFVPRFQIEIKNVYNSDTL